MQKGFEYLKGFAPETIVTAILFSMMGYFNGNNQTLWVMIQSLIQTLLVRLPLAYFMSIQPNASLTKIGLAAPVSTIVGIVLNIGFYLYWTRKQQNTLSATPTRSVSASFCAGRPFPKDRAAQDEHRQEGEAQQGAQQDDLLAGQVDAAGGYAVGAE